MASSSICTGIMRTWCLGLLLIASLSAAQAQTGAYGEATASGSYGYGAEAHASDSKPPTQDVNWVEQVQYGMRGLLTDDLLVQPTASAVPDPHSTSSDKSSDSDIVPKPLPTTQSWDSATAENWEAWFAEHFGSAAPAGAAGGAYGHSTGVGSYGYGPSVGPYGPAGAYFDIKSNKAYVPAVIQDDIQQQPIREQGPGAIPDAVSTSNSVSSDTAVNIAQVQPAQKPAIGGITRGRGTAIRQSRSPLKLPGQKQPEAAKSLRFDMAGTPIGPVTPAGRVPRRALRSFSRKLRLSTF